MDRIQHRYLWLVFFLAVPAVHAQDTSQLAPELRRKVDEAAFQVLKNTAVPSASIAIVHNGQIAYVQAYGNAKVDPPTPARPEMRYSIGSVSKQFTATAILLLAEQRKLSLDDQVWKYLPTLTRPREVTIRELLSHTSGYQDYWPQDYVPAFMMKPITADKLLDVWGRKQLDFDPGTQWQYSNTGYVIAGLIVEKVSGMRLMDFLKQKVFSQLGMSSVLDVDQDRLTETDPVGYMHYALGPLRVAPKEGAGWLFAAGELAMTAGDLAKWNLGMIEKKLLKPSSYTEMQTEVRLNNGLGTRYGLGVTVRSESGRRVLQHGGEVSGFTAENVIYPDDRAAITVLANADASQAAGNIAQEIAKLLFPSEQADADKVKSLVQRVFADLQQGNIDRSLFTDNGNGYFQGVALNDFASSLAPLGMPQDFSISGHSERGGMAFWGFQVKFPKETLLITVRIMPDGKIEQYQVAASGR